MSASTSTCSQTTHSVTNSRKRSSVQVEDDEHLNSATQASISKTGRKSSKKDLQPFFVNPNFVVPEVFKEYFTYTKTYEADELSNNKKNNVEAQCNLCSNDTKKKYIRCPENTTYNWCRHLKEIHQITVVPVRDIKQHTLDDFVGRKSLKLAYSDPLQQKFMLSVLDFIGVDGNPFRAVEGLGFRNMINTLSPSVRIPSRRNLDRLLAEKVKTVVLPRLKKELSTLPPNVVHISLDMWTTSARESILGVKVHFIDEAWQSQSKVLAYHWLPGSHTGERIQEALLSILKDRRIQQTCVGFIMADNAANITKAFNMTNLFVDNWDVGSVSTHLMDSEFEESDGSEDSDDDTEDLIVEDEFVEDEFIDDDELYDFLPWKRLRCNAHLLQLAINNAIATDSSVKTLVGYVNKIIVTFRKSPKRSEELKDVTCKELLSIGKTRWNSVLFALQRFIEDGIFLKVQQLLLKYQMEGHDTCAAPPFFRDKAKMVELMNLLKPLQVVTDVLQSNKVTSSAVILGITKAINDVNSVETNFFFDFKNTLLLNVKKRFQSVVLEEPFIIAAILDPRVKLKVFLGDYRNNLSLVPSTEATIILKRRFENLNSSTLDNDDMQVAEIPDSQKRKSEDMFDFLEKTVSQSGNMHKTEVELYLEEDCISKTIPPLTYWANNSRRFPVLSKLARIYLGLPATSGDVERLFSVCGNLKRLRRARLGNARVENILLWRDHRTHLLNKTVH